MGRAVRGRAGDSPLSKGAAQGVSKLRGGASYKVSGIALIEFLSVQLD